jgi:hypothetical protein
MPVSSSNAPSLWLHGAAVILLWFTLLGRYLWRRHWEGIEG